MTGGPARAVAGNDKLPVPTILEALDHKGLGKSRILALVATYLAVFRDYKPFLAPGEVATIAILAFNRAQARSIFRFVSGLFNAVPILKGMVVSETEEIITLSNRVVIEITAASFRSTRGYSFAAVLCDEVALWRLESESANPDTEILRALLPGMATIPGSILFLASSPYAKKGELYSSFQRHYAKDGARVLVWKAPTDVMNPGIDPAVIAEAYDEDPVSARAEYGGEFRDDLADYVSIEVVDSVTDFGCFERPYDPGNVYAGFVDPTGGSNDSFTMAVAHRAADGVCILDALHEVLGPCDPVKAARECAALAGRYSITRLVSDKYAGQWPVQAFLECGLILEQSAKPKSDLYHDFLPLLNSAQVRLLEHRRLRSQLVNLERRVARSGRDSIDHPKGGRDDVVNSAASVLVGLFLDRGRR